MHGSGHKVREGPRRFVEEVLQQIHDALLVRVLEIINNVLVTTIHLTHGPVFFFPNLRPDHGWAEGGGVLPGVDEAAGLARKDVQRTLEGLKRETKMTKFKYFLTFPFFLGENLVRDVLRVLQALDDEGQHHLAAPVGGGPERDAF